MESSPPESPLATDEAPQGSNGIEERKTSTSPHRAEKSWPAWLALLTAGFRPATTTRRTAHLSLWRAYAAFFFGALAILLGAAAAAGARHSGRSFSLGIVRALSGFASDLLEHPQRTLFYLGMALGLIGLASILVALVGLPFGARGESSRDSIRHALRRTWLHTGHVGLVICLGLYLQGQLDGAWSEWERGVRERFEHTNPRPTRPDRKDAEETKAYQAASQRHYQDFDRYRKSLGEPWYVAARDLLGSQILLWSAVWLVWAYFRGIAAPRATSAPPDVPPMCRFCGYNLSGTAADSRCPECGSRVEDSLGEHADPGASWEQRATLGRWSAYWRTFYLGMFKPVDLARCLRLSVPRGGCLRFLAINLVLCLAVILLAFTSYFWHQHNYYGNRSWLPSFLITVGIFVTIFYGGLVSATSLLVALREGIAQRRNLLAGVGQTAAYASSFLVAWALIGTAILILGHAGLNDFCVAGDLIGVPEELIAVLTWSGLIVLGIIRYVVLVFRAAQGLRYARR